MIRALTIAVALLALGPSARAHDGPPFPILVDEAFGDRTLSVWADPDVGVGTFYLYLPEERDGGLASDTDVTLRVRPSDGRLKEVRHFAEPAPPGAPYQRVAYADFDARGKWTLRFVLEGADPPAELSEEVDVTPPGTGGLAVLWFLTPFLLVGLLWVKAIRQRAGYVEVPA